jgi:ubiquinone/menaquinone biosynthesis C-methylase UbiE
VSFAHGYDRHRPSPPEALLELLVRLTGAGRPRLVVDLGSGTGLSTRAWAGRAERVIGVEPDAGMRAVAEEQGSAEYVEGDSEATGLEGACADLVTCSQSLHWMEPEPTFAEAARILRPGGVFAAYDYDAVPVVHPEVDAAFEDVLARAKELREGSDVWAPWRSRRPFWKEEHLSRMQESGHFRYAREAVLHSVEEGDADRVLGLIRSYGAIEMHKDELSLDELEATTRRALGAGSVPFWFGYRVRLGVR